MRRAILAALLSAVATMGVARAFDGRSSSSTLLRYNAEPAINFSTWATAHGVTDLSDGEQSTRGVANWLDYQASQGWKLVAVDSSNRYIFESYGRPSP